MNYTTQNDSGKTRHAQTIEGALSHAALMIYLGDKAREDARNALSNGKEATIVYGFKSVTITPNN